MTTPQTPSSDAVIQRARARADRIKQHLFRWIRLNSGPTDAMPMTIALLEIAIEGHLVMTENEEQTRDFIAKIFDRTIHKPAGGLQ